MFEIGAAGLFQVGGALLIAEMYRIKKVFHLMLVRKTSRFLN
ncbi:hypothetical protein D3OALGA1CA_2914 [Olavius algarvensis associated proteobacterium Delta 3]|nr:hypothetical protein D3OALGB2SA_2747 [Olavius algarvensis associated proteobacterium Delta 3]CAB5126166.1 hypothetical protein D3OALGA1CA_2914 [Olavius algarvensis associated proteobacterium Delta 3]